MLVITQARRRQLKALAIAPLVPSALLMLIAMMGRPTEGLWVCMFTLPLSYATLLFPGTPLYLLVLKMKWRSAWVYATIGVFCSFAASVIVWWGTFADKMVERTLSAWKPFIAFSVVAAILGFATGLLFWAIARPDRETVEVESALRDKRS